MKLNLKSKTIIKAKSIIRTIYWEVFDSYSKFIEFFQAMLEKRKGLDFATQVNDRQLGYKQSPYQSYQTGGMKRLIKILEKLKINKNDSVLDVGSGKGKSLYTLTKFPFNNVDGVEMSSELCEIAKNNLEKLNVNMNRINIYISDATLLTNLDKYNYFFLSNPFNGAPMETFIENVKKSYYSVPRKIVVIYFYPWCNNMFINSGIFKEYMSFKRYKVYKTK
ncbi:methyltransferase domain-containing protein [Seonamhaeicola sp. MEBiC1930]|uniref:methyltransferase domain-containing protein n=1 Tax=Seonamhaeicola sp. MEBiC01930 TaxID=2976768 RepID=UPI00324E7260